LNPIPQALIIGISNINNVTILTTIKNTNWSIGDQLKLYSCSPELDYSPTLINWTITDINGTQITIDTNFTFTPQPLSPYSSCINISVIYKNNNTIGSTFGALFRNKKVLLYRILGDSLNSSTFGGIPINRINGYQFDVFTILDKDNYYIIIPDTFCNKNVTGGGSNIFINSYVDGWRSTQANTVTGSNTDSSLLARAINLAGEYYILLKSNTLNYNSTFKISSPIDNVLAKINLIQSPGLMNYDGFDTSPTIFIPALSKLNSMHFEVITKQGYPFNFNNLNYAFTLRITEQHRVLVKSNENTRTH
jgi:hypothetical protein